MYKTKRMTREEYANMIQKFFDYFNGRVNIFNKPAKLILDWTGCRNSAILATTALPNIVTFFPEVALRMFDYDPALINETLTTVIHELMHVDQDIDPVRLRADEAYRKEIEDTIEYEAHMFIAQHMVEIGAVFNIHTFMDYRNFTPLLEAAGFLGHYYHRRNYISHVVHMIEDMVHESRSKTAMAIATLLSDPKTKVKVYIEDKCWFMIKIEDRAMPIAQLNDIMYENYFKYNYRGAEVRLAAHSFHSLDWEININTHCSNHMYELIGEEGSIDALLNR